jgi:hypothetical protein
LVSPISVGSGALPLEAGYARAATNRAWLEHVSAGVGYAGHGRSNDMSGPYFQQIRAAFGRETTSAKLPLKFHRPVSMTATVHSLPPNNDSDGVVDFLRRLASMLSGGRNAEMLLEAATTIEALTRRASVAEQRLQEQQADHAKNLELREVAEVASQNLFAEVSSLKAQLAESEATAEKQRSYFAQESGRLTAVADEANARVLEANDRILRVNAEIEELRDPAPTPTDESIAIVPVESLQLARTQFGYLAQGFAKNGDVVSQTICEIGARAIDKALAGDKDTRPAS